MKQREIDEKLEKLGIERRSEYDYQDTFGQRGRAASVGVTNDFRFLPIDICIIDLFSCRSSLANV